MWDTTRFGLGSAMLLLSMRHHPRSPLLAPCKPSAGFEDQAAQDSRPTTLNTHARPASKPLRLHLLWLTPVWVPTTLPRQRQDTYHKQSEARIAQTWRVGPGQLQYHGSMCTPIPAGRRTQTPQQFMQTLRSPNVMLQRQPQPPAEESPLPHTLETQPQPSVPARERRMYATAAQQAADGLRQQALWHPGRRSANRPPSPAIQPPLPAGVIRRALAQRPPNICCCNTHAAPCNMAWPVHHPQVGPQQPTPTPPSATAGLQTLTR